jgi:glucoamylase
VNTDAPGETVYLNGNLSVLGEGAPDWSPAGIPMTRVSATQWTATIHAASAVTLQYKYALGGSWNNVEQTASCGYVNNRSVPVNGGSVATRGQLGRPRPVRPGTGNDQRDRAVGHPERRHRVPQR